MKKIIISLIIFSLVFSTLVFLFNISPVSALNFKNTTELTNKTRSQTGLGDTDIRLVIANVIKAALGLLGVIFLALVIYGGFLWMFAAGETDKVKKARNTLITAVIGLGIILAAYSITHFVALALESAT